MQKHIAQLDQNFSLRNPAPVLILPHWQTYDLQPNMALLNLDNNYSQHPLHLWSHHQDLANQLFSDYAKVGDARNLASVIGEDELSPLDKKYLEFGIDFEQHYIGQGVNENRTMEETLDLGWKLLGKLPREELDRVDTKILDKYYKPAVED